MSSPYVYHPSYTYTVPNVQAGAQYYTQGGKDTAGAVYFISIPGVTDAREAALAPAQVPLDSSSSKHMATSQPRFLGGLAIIVRSFARIHETNLKTFVNPEDYGEVKGTDKVDITGLETFAPGKNLTLQVPGWNHRCYPPRSIPGVTDAAGASPGVDQERADHESITFETGVAAACLDE